MVADRQAGWRYDPAQKAYRPADAVQLGGAAPPPEPGVSMGCAYALMQASWGFSRRHSTLCSPSLNSAPPPSLPAPSSWSPPARQLPHPCPFNPYCSAPNRTTAHECPGIPCSLSLCSGQRFTCLAPSLPATPSHPLPLPRCRPGNLVANDACRRFSCCYCSWIQHTDFS
eukprot:359588-Chlamydomonas_euryale.AAC.4